MNLGMLGRLSPANIFKIENDPRDASWIAFKSWIDKMIDDTRVFFVAILSDFVSTTISNISPGSRQTHIYGRGPITVAET